MVALPYCNAYTIARCNDDVIISMLLCYIYVRDVMCMASWSAVGDL